MFTLIRIVQLIAIFAWSLFSQIAFAEQFAVTTYVTRVQEEREKTRWTLTEWLRIKERMKMMDVWLAMFSDPAKDRFRPELNLSWLVTRAAVDRKSGVASDPSVSQSSLSTGHTGKAQFWATNLVSSTVGIRTLNLDLGVETGQHDSGRLLSEDSLEPVAGSPRAQTNWYTANLRLFGKSIQDSSLVLKYGILQTTNSLVNEELLSNTAASNVQAKQLSSKMAGAELQLYLLKWLGAEGTYHAYLPTGLDDVNTTIQGEYSEAMGFIEISLIRFMAGRYEETWSIQKEESRTRSRETGYLAGIKLQI